MGLRAQPYWIGQGMDKHQLEKEIRPRKHTGVKLSTAALGRCERHNIRGSQGGVENQGKYF